MSRSLLASTPKLRQRILIISCIIVGSATFLILFANNYHSVDHRIYYGAITSWVNGEDLYEYAQPPDYRFGFTYPPFAAILMLPMVLLSSELAIMVSRIAIAATISLIVFYLMTPLAQRNGWSRWYVVAIAIPLASVLDPVRETMSFGQISLFLFALALIDVYALATGKKWAGLGIGLATAIKLTPGFLILYLLITRRWRAAATATGVAIAATLASAVVTPSLSWQFWSETLWNTERVGSLGSGRNQSLAGLLTRMANDDILVSRPDIVAWIVGVTLVVVIGLRRAYAAWRDGDDLAGFTVAGIAGALASPISWTHHLYWIVPAIVIMIDLRQWATAVATYVLFASGIIHYFWHPGGHHYDDGILGAVAESAYVLGCIVLLWILPHRRVELGSRND